MRNARRLGPTVVIGLAAAVTLAAAPGPPRPPADDRPYSNVYPDDYVGPATCAECHEQNHALWQGHAHARMNQDPDEDTVKGDFSGVSIRYGGGDRRVVFDRSGGDHFMTLYDGERLVRRFRVTRVVGSRFNQFYVGVQTEGPEPRDAPAYVREAKLPFAYWFGMQRWLPEIYFDSYPPAEYDYAEGASYPDHIFDHPPDHLWEQSCIGCHNTYPYVARLKGGGQVWDRGFPDGQITLQHLAGEAPWVPFYKQAPDIRAHELVTLGISCESCHFGGREHALRGREIRWVPTGADIEVEIPGLAAGETPGREHAYVINSICRQCHSAEVDRYPNGTAAWNSSESIDQDLGACASAIKCTDCHNPHRAGAPGGAPDPPRSIRACLDCHEQYRAPEAQAAHSGHAAEAGVSCLDCHMPRVVQGLETMVRTHRISSPTDQSMLAVGLPNACNVCHVEQSIGWTVEHLRRGWGAEIAIDDAWTPWYGGSLDTPVGHAWLAHPAQPTRMVGAHAYARSPWGADVLTDLLGILLDEHAVNRTFGLLDIERILGRRLTDAEYDLLAPPDIRREQVDALRTRFGAVRVQVPETGTD